MTHLDTDIDVHVHIPFSDHLLSYFLGDQHALQSQRSFGGVAEPQSLTSVTRTPAVHFYGSSSSKGSKVPRAAPLGSASSSSSSLSSMAATLVSGGPVLHQYHQHPNHRPATTSPPSISPISPAATMGTPQEMLMLPPPPRNPTDQSEVERRRQHVAWLNQVNAMALMNQQQQQVPAYALAPTPVYPPPPSQQQPQESEERRAKRLARNRESARQSRRRKKENLARLSAKVNGLQGEIEVERRLKLNDMEDNMQRLRSNAIQNLPEESVDPESIRELLDSLGPNCAIRQNCTSFQYSALRQLMLPKYQVFILWLTKQEGSFFTAGKEEKIKIDPSRVIGRLSSKQVGEEITTIWKKALPKETKSYPSNDGLLDADEEDDDRTLKSGPDEPTRLWPLVCYELSISVDQEEKILAFCKSARESVTLPHNRRLMADATKMVSNMKRGVLTHGQSTVGRSENLFLSTLSADQSAKYFKWYAENGDRLKKTHPVTMAKQEPCETDQESSLSDICKRLQDVLKIPSNEHMASPLLEALEPPSFDGHQFQ